MRFRKAFRRIAQSGRGFLQGVWGKTGIKGIKKGAGTNDQK